MTLSDKAREKAIELIESLHEIENQQGVPDYDCLEERLEKSFLSFADEVLEEAAKVTETIYPKTHTHASENSGRYRIQDETCLLTATKIRSLKEIKS